MRRHLAVLAVAIGLASQPPAFSEIPAEDLTSEDREAQPIRPPQPSYPQLAARVGLPGRCTVLFDVDHRGYPVNIRPFCTHPVFCQSASEAMSKVVFTPKTIGGHAVPRSNVVYPLEYMIGDNEEDQKARSAKIAGKPELLCPNGIIS